MIKKRGSKWAYIPLEFGHALTTTVEHGQLITKKNWGDHKVITAEQQFLGLILWFFMYRKVASRFEACLVYNHTQKPDLLIRSSSRLLATLLST